MTGEARDLLTPPAGAPSLLASASFRLIVSPAREILELETSPAHPRAHELVGTRGGGASRMALGQNLGDLRGTPLFQLLDDFAGASLVAGWIWSRWTNDGIERAQEVPAMQSNARMVNICTGFAAGASSLTNSGAIDTANASSTVVDSLENPDDPYGWHLLAHQQGPRMRRARRIDLWREDGIIKIDAGFQDSGGTPDGGRIAIHEYRVHAEVDAVSGVLMAMQAQPLILPYRECPGASVKATRMIGKLIADFRSTVIATLPSTLGCTHLNDVLRALADVPALAGRLPVDNN